MQTSILKSQISETPLYCDLNFNVFEDKDKVYILDYWQHIIGEASVNLNDKEIIFKSKYGSEVINTNTSFKHDVNNLTFYICLNYKKI